MFKNKTYKTIFKERLTILMVLLFCVLVSSSEYILLGDSETVQTEKHPKPSDSSEDDAAFINIAVDAVVPFVVVILDQTLHLISEVIGLDRQPTSQYIGLVHHPNQFFEILFEHIVSTNAP